MQMPNQYNYGSLQRGFNNFASMYGFPQGFGFG